MTRGKLLNKGWEKEQKAEEFRTELKCKKKKKNRKLKRNWNYSQGQEKQEIRKQTWRKWGGKKGRQLNACRGGG